MPKSPTRNPLYAQVADYVMQQIAAGSYRPHQAIPTEWQLAKKLDVSQGTVRKGLDELVFKQILYRQQGVGTFVADQYGDWGLYGLVGTFEKESHSFFPKSEVLSVVAVHAGNEISDLLYLRAANPLVWKVLVLWRHQIHLVALDEIFLPYERLQDLNRRQLMTRLGIESLLLKEYELRLNDASCMVSVGGLSVDLANVLKVSAEEPVLYMQIKKTDAYGEMMMLKRRYILTRHYQLNLSANSIV